MGQFTTPIFFAVLLLSAAAAPWLPRDDVDASHGKAPWPVELERESSAEALQAAANKPSGVMPGGAITMPISSFYNTDGSNREPTMLIRKQIAACPECAAPLELPDPCDCSQHLSCCGVALVISAQCAVPPGEDGERGLLQ